MLVIYRAPAKRIGLCISVTHVCGPFRLALNFRFPKETERNGTLIAVNQKGARRALGHIVLPRAVDVKELLLCIFTDLSTRKGRHRDLSKNICGQ